MPVCEFGTRVKSGVGPTSFWIEGSAALDQISSYLGGVAAFINTMIDQFAPSFQDLNVLCASPPPAPPNPDLLTLFTSGEWARVPQGVVDWFWSAWQSAKWNDYCECVPGAAQICSDHQTGSVSTALGATVTTYSFAPFPPGTTGITLTNTFTNTVGTWQIKAEFQKPDGSFDTAVPIAVRTAGSPGGTQTQTVTWPTPGGYTPIGIRQRISRSVGSGTQSANWDVNWTLAGCSATVPTTPYVPPAAPSPPAIPVPPSPPTGCSSDDICARLYQLQRMLSIISTEVDATYLHVTAHLPVDCPDCINPPCPPCPDCITGAPPFLPGAAHSPLSGSGSLAISELVGMRVQLVAKPAGHLELEGQPKYEWNMGWMSIMNGDSLLEEKRVTRDSFVWLPFTMKLADTFTWTLREGVSIEAIELEPDPGP